MNKYDITNSSEFRTGSSEQKNIRNFVIIAHIDHGKSTLADRMLELTGTIEKRKMREQALDTMELERERGITIKLAPVRMMYHFNKSEFDRRHTQTGTQNNAEYQQSPSVENTQNNAEDFLYKDLTYKVRGILFSVRKNLGLGHKEQVYHNAVEIELKKAGILFESKKNIPIKYDGTSIGIYQPDFVIDNKLLIELKALPEIGKPQIEQLWAYLKGCDYKLALLVNYGSKDLEIKRVVYDTARAVSALSASSPRVSAGVSHQIENGSFVLNLIDTPGHIDFAYEVSRALKAVDGAILLVDATQGVQAQTLSVLEMARELGLSIIPVVSKIDSPLARTDEVAGELAHLLDTEEKEVLRVSGKTGEGVTELLAAIILRIPPPSETPLNDGGLLRESALSPRVSANALRALVFDFEYSTHRGIVVYVRVFSGVLKSGDDLKCAVTGIRFKALEVGTLGPSQHPADEIRAGEIGYIVTGIKEAARAVVGDTVTSFFSPAPALSGYKNPQPVVWASLFPESQDDFSVLKTSLEELKLEDPSLHFDEELSPVLGRGFRSGFLGMLHLEIVLERLKREFGAHLVVASPSIVYEVVKENGERRQVYSPAEFPDYGAYKEVYEPLAEAHIITPIEYMGKVSQTLYRHEAVVGESENWSGNRASFQAKLPLRELMRGFFDELKNVSSGYASFSYEIVGSQKADVVRLDILVADERIPAFSQVIARATAYDEAKRAVERLSLILPRQLFVTKIQGVAQGRILSSKTLSALKKDVTGYLYGGDITRKKKLWEKQKRGKKKMKERGKVEIPHEVFLKMLKKV